MLIGIICYLILVLCVSKISQYIRENTIMKKIIIQGNSNSNGNTREIARQFQEILKCDFIDLKITLVILFLSLNTTGFAKWRIK